MVTIHSFEFEIQFHISEIKHSAIAPKLNSKATAPKLKLNLFIYLNSITLIKNKLNSFSIIHYRPVTCSQGIL